MHTGDHAFDRLTQAVGIAEPYHWQRQAWQRLLAGDVPGSVVVPTAAGKTQLITAFVAALAAQALRGHVTLPRRLVHVVNRRILVDEATRLAQQLAQALATDPALASLADALRGLSSSACPLAVSTLRGGAGDNGTWSLDPSTPAVILATPDMLGSRLLFRGYGLGRSRCATHAGLLGCDTLVVHDEAHLAPAFTTLLRQIEALAADGARQLGRPPLQVLEMTATLGEDRQTRPLVCDVAADERLRRRLSAPKQLWFADVHPGASNKAPAAVLDRLTTLALDHRDGRRAVAVFVSNPAQAGKLAERLAKAGIGPDRIVLLTGTLRGHERARLTASAAFRRFDPGPQRLDGETAYFIATSAGEIGLDIDADVGLFDLTTLDRFVQRCGRINRRGMGEGDITLVHARGEELPAALLERAIQALRQLQALPGAAGGRDASPLALSHLARHPDYPLAIDPLPALRRLEPAVISMLSMTSYRLDEIGCPSPEVFIHGLVDDDAQVALAWRELPRNGSDLSAWLDAWPLSPAETARLPLEAAQRLLRARLSAAPAAEAADAPCALALDAQGIPVDGSAFRPGDNLFRWAARLRPGQTVLLDSRLGGLNPQGLPDPAADAPVPDVSADTLTQDVERRGAARACAVLRYDTDPDSGTAVWQRAVAGQDIDDRDGSGDAPPGNARTPGTPSANAVLPLLAQLFPGQDILFHDAPRPGDGHWQGPVQVWLCARAVRGPDSGDEASLAPGDRALQEHLDLTAQAAAQLARALPLSPAWRDVLVRAGAEHDRGKAWARWQRAIGNADPARPLGKSGRGGFDHRLNDGYRHELGSLVDLTGQRDWLQSHLIATHHGWGRPSYRDAALAKPGCLAVASEVALGFDRLGQALGPWAVCYAEALLKAADVLAEVRAGELAQLGPPPQTGAGNLPDLPSRPVCADRTHIRVDVTNFGEYLAALGLATLMARDGAGLRIGWTPDECLLEGVSPQDIHHALRRLCQAEVDHDRVATVAAQVDAPYPPLRLRLPDGRDWCLNHWLDERLREGSAWKLGAGQTTAHTTLSRLLASCSRALDHPAFDVSTLLTFGGARVEAAPSKFRFDAATNWTAHDAGFSLNESEHFKSVRPWVELLSVLGLQQFFLPPADTRRRYHVWDGLLPPDLALAAAKGLLPVCTQGYEPVILPSGKMKDVFTSRPLQQERNLPCQNFIRLI